MDHNLTAKLNMSVVRTQLYCMAKSFGCLIVLALKFDPSGFSAMQLALKINGKIISITPYSIYPKHKHFIKENFISITNCYLRFVVKIL